MSQVQRYNVLIGTNLFTNTPCAIGKQRGDNTIIPLLHARIRENDEQLQFSFDATDETGTKIRVRNNVPVGVDSERFEVRHLADQKLVVSRDTGSTILDIRTVSQHAIGRIEIYGKFIFEDMLLVSTEQGLNIGELTMVDNQFVNCEGILFRSNGSFALGFRGTIPPLSDV